MNKDRGNTGLLEPGFETPKNRIGSFDVVSISLWIPNAPRQSPVRPKGQDNPHGTYGLENDIVFRGKLLQTHDVIEGSKDCLEPQLLESLGLFGGADVDSDFVVGPFGVLDEMGEDGASNVTWSIKARMSDKHSGAR